MILSYQIVILLYILIADYVVLYKEGGCYCHCVPQKYTKRWVLTDFGLSTCIGSGRVGISIEKRGTPGYRAPELADIKYDTNGKEKAAEYTRGADIWAVGCIIIEIATTKKSTAFGRGDWAVVNFARGAGDLPQIMENDNPLLVRETFCPQKKCRLAVWKQLNSIIQRCLTPKPENRITAMELKARFEKMKYFLIMDANEEEKNRWLGN